MPHDRYQTGYRHEGSVGSRGFGRAVMVLSVLLATACHHADAPGTVRVQETRPVMGTTMTITVYARDEATGHRVIAAAFDRVEEIEAALSHYREQSDLSKLGRAAGGPMMPISRDLYDCLRRSIEVSVESHGAFDASIAPLMILWKNAWKAGKLPSEAELAAARALVDYRSIRLDPNGPRAHLLRPGMRLDLGGIGKGYAVDQVVAFLRSKGIRAALVALSGEIYALGAPPGREGWRIGVRDPSQPRGPVVDPADMPILSHPLILRDRAVSTSGDYEQFGVIDGRRYSHILNPATGQPVVEMASVSVVAPDSATADSYGLVLSVLGPKAGLDFAAKHQGVEVMILHEAGGKLETLRSGGFGKLEDKKDKEDKEEKKANP